jgi:pilus assembly protein CpaC
LLVVVTPELVRPSPAGQPVPAVKMPAEFFKGGSASPPRTPGADLTGPVPAKPPQETVPVEQLREKPGQGAAPAVQYIPLLPVPVPAPGGTPAQSTPSTPKP